MMKATISDVAMVEIITGSDWPPTDITVLMFSENPKIITAYCKIFFDVNVMPAFMLSEGANFGNSAVIIIPIMIAKTGAPITSKEKFPMVRPDRKVETAATVAAIAIPGPLDFINSIFKLLCRLFF